MTLSRSLRLHESFFEEEFKRPAAPSHRHAAPSAPWPWIDIEDEVDPTQLSSHLPPVPEPCLHVSCGGCWREYPQALYPNWTPSQVKKSQIEKAVKHYRRNVVCVIHQVDVNEDGIFQVPNPGRITSTDNKVRETWEDVIRLEAPDYNRVRILFVENLSGPVLQMLGTKYNIEPFFFSSSLNWIPSRYVESVVPGEGDHITISLTFVRSVALSSVNSINSIHENASQGAVGSAKQTSLAKHMIDTQAPLVLQSNNRVLLLDLLSVHLIRKKHGSVIVSYHPDNDNPTTKAPYLHERIRFAGQSVYWQSIFQKSPDPTFVLLTFIWHALYAWDEAMENLYEHICYLETEVVSTSEMALTQELHIIRAHHLHYASLLEDFRKSVVFVRDTVNPTLDSLPQAEREANHEMLERECANLLGEVQRLETARKMHDMRLKNVMNLVFSSINILDSRRIQKMTEAAAQDSAGMKQIAYLTMIFLPGSFVAAVFGMNVQEIVPSTHGTLAHYAETALPLTLLTIWVIIASQNRYIFPPGLNFWMRLGWPVLVLGKVLSTYPIRWTWTTSAKKGTKEGEGSCPTVAMAMTNVAKGG
ncbi:hypothetical protein HYPSUDRAFT_39284 [Hypholoma sublateritium FD-334 SS-4]|uniref:Uncharacterized protein n=1 Tax=Hypholoma sublateritium (strain FD-334 SS-4) TaxID=945553 RepID=A0A0D2MKB8_HYPSF|nr:hypothetical protein HYPSUDRAFT_39284 [Hypholoma sublateritium FD-334 SS-4]